MVGAGLGLAAVILIGTALAALQVLPTRELLARTPRGEAVDYSFLTFGSFPPWQAATFVAADLFGTPVNGSFWAGRDWSHFAETCVFMGVPTLALAGVALLLRRDLPTRLLAAVTSLSFVLMLGKYTPAYRILAWLPLWQSTRLPGRFALLFALAVALLAGLGLGALLREKNVTRRRTALAVGVAPLLLLAALAVGLGAEARTSDPGLELGRAWPAKLEAIGSNTDGVFGRLGIVMAVGLATLVPFGLRRRPSRLLAAGPTVVVALDLLTWGSSFNPLVPLAVVTEPPPVVAALPFAAPRARVFRQGVDEMWERAPGAPRVDMFTPAWKGNESTYSTGAWTLPPNSQLLYGVDSGEGFTSLIPLQWLEWMGLSARPGATPRPDLTDAQADLLSIDAVISTGSGIAGEGWESSSLPGGVWLSRNTDPMPRVRLAHSWEVIDREEVLERVRSDDHDLRGRVLLERGPAGSRSAHDRGPVDGPLPARELGPGAWEIDVPPASEGLVVLAESWDPDWIATDAEDRELPVLRADGLFVSFFAPSDGGTVRLRHAPRSVRTGAIVSAVALVILVGLLVYGRRLRLPKHEVRPEAAGVGPIGNAIPVAIAAAVITGSWVSDIGGWSDDRQASTLSAAAARAWVDEAHAAYKAGALDPAAQLLRSAQDRAPRDASIPYRLGVVEQARGRYNVARTAFERALELDPSMASARDALRAMNE
jgi:hypothetical protein